MVKYAVFIENENEFLKILIFATHGLMTILNKCSKFQNDLINILGDIGIWQLYTIEITLCGIEMIEKNVIPIGYDLRCHISLNIY